LNKKDQALLEKIKTGEEKYHFKIFNGEDKDDWMSLIPLPNMKDVKDLREKIGTVMRGGFSQIRGKGFAISLVEKDKI
jgi:glycine cleavage system aminomethyltransferase T